VADFLLKFKTFLKDSPIEFCKMVGQYPIRLGIACQDVNFKDDLIKFNFESVEWLLHHGGAGNGLIMLIL